MNKKIKILHLEDSIHDSELIRLLIDTGGLDYEYFLADNEKDFKNILENKNIDIILSDYSLPDYNGNEALIVAREKYFHIPFIFLSGIIGEDAAINAMLNSATDYVFKNKLERLVPAIKRALHEHLLEINRKKAEFDLIGKNVLIEAQNERYIVINKELIFQNEEKEKRAAELVIANKELVYQNEEKEKRAAELIIANILKETEEKYKLVIEEKNKKITDSINYAKRIQQAKLPRKEYIYESLPQSFILFKPKDTISGDFYFFHKNHHSVYIVAADCTGHGVPGALLSMIGSDKLLEAVSQSDNTSDILKHLNIEIKNSLHQSDSFESTSDGMEVAICSINTEDRLIKFAGANRPFWLIRNGGNVVEEIRGTKMAIGGYTENEQYFDSHELKLKQGDTFYLFTDGYADQFGGKDGKKLMKNKFKKILVEIQGKSMIEQEKHLDNYIENWKDAKEQIDDILVIGVRV